MYKGITLSASLMCIDWMNAGAQMEVLEKHPIDYLHLDIIDGNFAPDFTMGSSIIDVFRERTTLKSDYHLMVEEPSRLFNAFKVGPGDIFTIHQETSRNLHRDLVSIRRMQAKVGVALSPGTPLDALEYVIEDTDVILLMMVDPGYKGMPLVPQTLRKLHNLREMIDRMGLNIRISVDGNVQGETLSEMIAAGADMLVLGSSGLFRKDIGIEEALTQVYANIDYGLAKREGQRNK